MYRKPGCNWADLPPDILLLIIQKLITLPGNDFKAVADLRRTCRAWRATCSQYPATLLSRSTANVSQLCHTFPQLASISLTYPPCTAEQLQSLICCKQLTSLGLTHHSLVDSHGKEAEPQVPRYLRKSLQDMFLLKNQPICCSNKYPSSVTHSSCSNTSGSQEDSTTLLQCLPQLKV